MARGKVGAVRLVANWALIEPTDDAWRFGALDNYVGDLAASGIRPFPVLFNTSPFVGSDGLRLPVHSAQDKQQWKEFVAMVAQRYGPGGAYWTTQYPIDHPGEQPSPVKALQVWNEQNGSKHAHDPDPSEYADLVKISNDAIESVGTDVWLTELGWGSSKKGRLGVGKKEQAKPAQAVVQAAAQESRQVAHRRSHVVHVARPAEGRLAVRLVLHRRPVQGQRHQAQAGLEAVRPLYRRVVSYPPAIAGRIMTVSASETGVSRPSSTRTSSSFR